MQSADHHSFINKDECVTTLPRPVSQGEQCEVQPRHHLRDLVGEAAGRSYQPRWPSPLIRHGRDRPQGPSVPVSPTNLGSPGEGFSLVTNLTIINGYLGDICGHLFQSRTQRKVWTLIPRRRAHSANLLLYVVASSLFSKDKRPPFPFKHASLLCMWFLSKITKNFFEELKSP